MSYESVGAAIKSWVIAWVVVWCLLLLMFLPKYEMSSAWYCGVNLISYISFWALIIVIIVNNNGCKYG